jgi:hypothetical protein
MSRIAGILDRLRFARTYTRWLLDATPEDQWFQMPGGVTHVAYQVGHLAIAQFRLCLKRCRADQPDDNALLPLAYLDLFGKLPPSPDVATYPPLTEIRATFDRVHERVLAEVPTFREPDLDLPPLVSHPKCQTRGECLDWAAAHEMLHAGQIGLLRRLLGHKPLW